MTYNPFDVVAVPFPFTEIAVAKRRPALVVSSSLFNRQHSQVILLMITTARFSTWVSDVELLDYEFSNLKPNSKVRFKIFTLDAAMITARIGQLSITDQASVADALNQVLGFGIFDLRHSDTK